MIALVDRSRRYGRVVVAGALAAAALALPACGGTGAGDSPAAPSTPGGNVDPAAQSGVGGVINKAKDTAGNVEQHDATLSTAATQP
jgi:hypothetical protein